MSHNFAAVEPKTLKVHKITYFVVLGNVETRISPGFENLNKQKIARRPFMNIVYKAEIYPKLYCSIFFKREKPHVHAMQYVLNIVVHILHDKELEDITYVCTVLHVFTLH